jgi:hypothetical protein
MLRIAAVTLTLAVLLPAIPAAAAWWPPDVAKANDALVTARSYRIITTEGPTVTTVEVQRPDRERITTNGQTVVRIGDRVWLRNGKDPWQDVSKGGAGRLAALAEITLPPNAGVMREADASDGVSNAHLYHVIYPSGTPQLRWYIRVSDGRLHAIRRAGKNYAVTATIDRYDGVPPITAPMQ